MLLKTISLIFILNSSVYAASNNNLLCAGQISHLLSKKSTITRSATYKKSEKGPYYVYSENEQIVNPYKDSVQFEIGTLDLKKNTIRTKDNNKYMLKNGIQVEYAEKNVDLVTKSILMLTGNKAKTITIKPPPYPSGYQPNTLHIEYLESNNKCFVTRIEGWGKLSLPACYKVQQTQMLVVNTIEAALKDPEKKAKIKSVLEKIYTSKIKELQNKRAEDGALNSASEKYLKSYEVKLIALRSNTMTKDVKADFAEQVLLENKNSFLEQLDDPNIKAIFKDVDTYFDLKLFLREVSENYARGTKPALVSFCDNYGMDSKSLNVKLPQENTSGASSRDTESR